MRCSGMSYALGIGSRPVIVVGFSRSLDFTRTSSGGESNRSVPLLRTGPCYVTFGLTVITFNSTRPITSVPLFRLHARDAILSFMPTSATLSTKERLLLRALLLGARLMLHCAGGYFRLLLRLELSAPLVLRLNSFEILDQLRKRLIGFTEIMQLFMLF